MSPLQLVVVGLAGFAAGAVNALAGGGTLISFPVLLALGLPPISANVTNTVALSPGYLGGALSQRRAIADQSARVRRLALAAGLGGITGGVLLLVTSDSVFRVLIPVLLFAASLLLLLQDRIRTALGLDRATPAPTTPAAAGAGAVADLDPTDPEGAPQATATDVARPDPRWLPIPVFVVSVYGGYFGAGLGIMFLAVLGILLHDTLPRLNALKQILALVVNSAAAILFVTSDKVYWDVALVMAVASLVGGSVGGRLAGSIPPARLRVVVVGIGFAVAVAYAVKIWL